MVSQFRWIVDGLLAGSGKPGLLNPPAEDWSFIREMGIRLVVNLTEEELEPGPSHCGLAGLHFPVTDMGAPPSPRAADALCQQVVASMARREPVLLHCKAGVGRTGTLLSCCLVALGRSAAAAISEVRRRSHGAAIETDVQVQFVHHYEKYLKDSAPDRLKAEGEGPREALPNRQG